MKIKMYGMSQEGKIISSMAEIVEGENAEEIVRAMMNQTPFCNGQSNAEYMKDVLGRIGMPEQTTTEKEFLKILENRGLIAIE